MHAVQAVSMQTAFTVMQASQAGQTHQLQQHASELWDDNLQLHERVSQLEDDNQQLQQHASELKKDKLQLQQSVSQLEGGAQQLQETVDHQLGQLKQAGDVQVSAMSLSVVTFILLQCTVLCFATYLSTLAPCAQCYTPCHATCKLSTSYWRMSHVLLQCLAI